MPTVTVVVVAVVAIVVLVVDVMVFVDVEPHCVKPSGHVCIKVSANWSHIPVPTNLHGPLLPPKQSWQSNAGGNDVVTVVVGAQYVMPGGHVFVATSSNNAHTGLPE